MEGLKFAGLGCWKLAWFYRVQGSGFRVQSSGLGGAFGESFGVQGSRMSTVSVFRPCCLRLVFGCSGVRAAG